MLRTKNTAGTGSGGGAILPPAVRAVQECTCAVKRHRPSVTASDLRKQAVAARHAAATITPPAMKTINGSLFLAAFAEMLKSEDEKARLK